MDACLHGRQLGSVVLVVLTAASSFVHVIYLHVRVHMLGVMVVYFYFLGAIYCNVMYFRGLSPLIWEYNEGFSLPN